MLYEFWNRDGIGKEFSSNGLFEKRSISQSALWLTEESFPGMPNAKQLPFQQQPPDDRNGPLLAISREGHCYKT